ncbi:hypothetical protein I350_07320 [Cryptococcus amylolentus CBS 6273]|uniref:Kri1-like C-terminal domain-containing protein n=1 Tax=Cryptococcus amylolentus CBS 6273 TaxID=1296118 RepID=A0A1E3JEB0_9TREE|nr:hypothetical protein I350_07320 [Cryptococcus amylolentus CBS 6273]
MKAESTELKQIAPSSEEDYSSDDSSSSEDVTEDEDGAELTPAMDAAILRTLRKIKGKEGDIYGKENIIQAELKKAQELAQSRGLHSNVIKKAVEKPYLLQDYHRKKLLEGKFGEDEEDDEPLTHVESQYRLRQEARSAFAGLAEESDDNDSDGEGFLKKRDKEGDEVDADDEEYRKFLLEMGGGEEEVKQLLGMGDQPAILQTVDDDDEEEPGQAVAVSKVEKEEMKNERKKKQEMKIKDDDDFLMNYILNRGWIDRTDDHVPTYDEVVGKTTSEEPEQVKALKASTSSHPWGSLDDDEDFEDRAEQFETEYNFRFEEPGSSTIMTHPRDIASLVRRPDDARKSKRARKAERKAAEKAAMEEGLKKEKGKKRRDVETKMEALKRDLEREGVKGVELDKLGKVLDGEWDETIWDKVVGGMIGDDAEDDDNVKPTWDDDLGDAPYDDDAEEGDFHYEATGEDADDMDVDYDNDGPINMDADFLDEEPTSKKSKKKSRKDKQSKHRNPSPSPEPEEERDKNMSIAEKAQALKEAAESYNALAYEDFIGDMPTRFKYTQAPSASFGLTPAEILLATDDELNQIVGMKSIAPYKKGGIGMAGKGLGQRVRQLKEQLKERRWGEEPGMPSSGKREKKRKREHHDTLVNGEASGETAAEHNRADREKKTSDKVKNGKRMGKKERQRLQAAEASSGEIASADVPAMPVAVSSGSEVPANEGVPEGGEKKKRRKKNKSKGEVAA